jgi:hypothetical protein
MKLVKLVQLSKQLPPKNVTDCGIVIYDKLVQLLKQLELKLVTDGGNVIDDKLVQF